MPTVVAVEVDNEFSKVPIEVTIRMSDGHVRWCFFATPEMLKACGDTLPGTRVKLHFSAHMIVMTELDEHLIKMAVHHMEQQGELIGHTLPLP